jgi:DNA-binding response OmpR family regulator
VRILIVEDHADTARSLATVVQLWGHQAQVAPNGEAALVAGAATPPEVVLLDIGLPGMNGWDVAKRLRAMALTPRPVIIAISGYGRDTDRLQSYEAGIDNHLTKPVDPAFLQELLARVEEHRTPSTAP